MIVHSDSLLWFIVAHAITYITVVILAVSASMFFSRKFARAALVMALGVGLFGAYLLAFIVMTPQKIVTVGDSYCEDIWCLKIDGVTASPQGQETVYKVDVHIFSDANRVQTSAKGYVIYLSDEHGRRFPLVNDSSVIPFDVTLNPGQSVQTSLTFLAAKDAQHLYLMGDGKKPTPAWVSFLARLYSGGDSKPALIRVL